MQPISVTLTFANTAELVSYFQRVSLLPVAQDTPAPKPASAASGQTTAKADAPAKTTNAKSQPAASAETAAPASTAATASQETEFDPNSDKTQAIPRELIDKAIAEAKKPAGTQPTASPTASAASSTTPVEYPVLQKAVFTLAGKSREAAAAVAASMGVKTFKELDAARWGEALASVNAKIAELG